MKVPLLFVASLIACVTAAAVDQSAEAYPLVARDCGAADSCQGFGWGEDLCNDRCKKCQGDSGYYKRGECCGMGLYTCCCYYD